MVVNYFYSNNLRILVTGKKKYIGYKMKETGSVKKQKI